MLSLISLIVFSTADAYVDPACMEVADTDGDGTAGPAPEGYSEAQQNNYLLNFYSLATTFSALHAPVPHEPGTGSLGIELSGIPALPCEKRLVMSYTKTEDTNKTPVLPRPRGSFAFPSIDLENGKSVVPYAGFGYVPPVPIGGTRNVMVSMEAGVGYTDLQTEGSQFGLRYHATLMRTLGEIATPFDIESTAYEDLYLGSTFGLDLSYGYQKDAFTHYASVGWLDVSTFFYIDDDAVISNNMVPYAGPTISLGSQWKPKSFLDVAGELYAAPTTLFDLDGFSVSPGDGSIYTARFKVAYLF